MLCGGRYWDHLALGDQEDLWNSFAQYLILVYNYYNQAGNFSPKAAFSTGTVATLIVGKTTLHEGQDIVLQANVVAGHAISGNEVTLQVGTRGSIVECYNCTPSMVEIELYKDMNNAAGQTVRSFFTATVEATKVIADTAPPPPAPHHIDMGGTEL